MKAVMFLVVFGALYLINRLGTANSIKKSYRELFLIMAMSISSVKATLEFSGCGYWFFMILGIYIFIHIYDTVADIIRYQKEQDKLEDTND